MFQEVATAAFATAMTVEKEVSAVLCYVSSDGCSSSSSSSSTSSSSSHTTTTTHQSYSLWIWTTFILLVIYTIIQLLSNAVAWYQFFVAWSLIARANRVDVNLVHHHKTTYTNRRNHIHQAIQTHSYAEQLLRLDPLQLPKPNHNNHNSSETPTPTTTATGATTSDSTVDSSETSSCPICLMDFEASDRVSACKDHQACRHFFHEQCLKDWLYKQPSCPCCRFEILPSSLPPTELPPPSVNYS